MGRLLAIILFLACASLAQAQAYPSKSVKLIVAFAAGGTSDLIGRLLAQQLAAALGQPVVVENRIGSNGIIGTDYTAKSPPDGYTILIAPSGHAINNSLNPNVPYDPIRDFSFITLIGTVPMVISANQAFAPNTIAELIAYAKQNPGTINFGSGGPGSSNQLATELFAHMAGIRMTHIPYKGDAPGITDLLAGQISFVFLNTPAALPLVKGGKAKALGITSENRSALLPDLPAIGETVPGYVAGSWHGIFAPAGVPQPIVARLNAELVKIIRSPEIHERLTSWGVNVAGSSSADFEAFVKAEIVKWANVIKTANVRLP
jgi:tripartite-type tricarboxylate transporter receptor subunit TctC